MAPKMIAAENLQARFEIDLTKALQIGHFGMLNALSGKSSKPVMHLERSMIRIHNFLSDSGQGERRDDV